MHVDDEAAAAADDDDEEGVGQMRLLLLMMSSFGSTHFFRIPGSGGLQIGTGCAVCVCARASGSVHDASASSVLKC